MITYEVHINRKPGTVDEPRVVWATDPETDEIIGCRTTQSLMLRTTSRDLAERLRYTWNDTARRSDDRVAWIREVPDA